MSQLQTEAFGEDCIVIRRNQLASFFPKPPSPVQVLRCKDVPFWASAAQDGLTPTLSAPARQEKALFVSFLKAPQWAISFCFKLTSLLISALSPCQRNSIAFNCSPCAGHHGICKDMQIKCSQYTPMGNYPLPLLLRKSQKKNMLGFGFYSGEENSDCRFSLGIFSRGQIFQ